MIFLKQLCRRALAPDVAWMRQPPGRSFNSWPKAFLKTRYSSSESAAQPGQAQGVDPAMASTWLATREHGASPLHPASAPERTHGSFNELRAPLGRSVGWLFVPGIEMWAAASGMPISHLTFEVTILFPQHPSQNAMDLKGFLLPSGLTPLLFSSLSNAG